MLRSLPLINLNKDLSFTKRIESETIIDCVIDVITAANTSTNLSVGDTVGGAATILNTFASGTTAGRKYPTTQAGAALAWQDTGTADIRLTVTASAATNAGLVRFTILYQQNNNLA